MSYYFEISSAKRINLKDLLAAIPHPEVEVVLEAGLSPDHLISGFYRLFIPEKSTRGVSLNYEGDTYSVGINILASTEDYELAVQTAHALAQLTGSAVQTEDREQSIGAAELIKNYDRHWIDSHKISNIQMIPQLAAEAGNNAVIISGCLRNHYIGPKLLQRLGLDGKDPLLLYNTLIDNIRQTQFIDGMTYYLPDIYEAEEKEGSEKWQYVVFNPDSGNLLPKVDYVIFVASEQQYYKLPFDKIEIIKNDKFTLLDEYQWLIAPMTETELALMLEKLTPYLMFF